jgi:hypothetical protein
MKCGYCGSENLPDSNFCVNCGRELDRALHCTSCGKELLPKSRFCVYCGAKINTVVKAASRASAQENRARYVNKHKKPAKSRKPRLTRSSLIGYVVVIVIVLGVAGYFIAAFPNRGSNTSRNNLNSGLGDNLVWSQQVQTIASNFNCPCGACGVTRLDVCTCDAVRGAVETKNYIQRLINQGLPEEDIIGKVEERYGNRI